MTLEAPLSSTGMAKVKTEVQDEPLTDELDLMPLSKRRRILLSDKLSSSAPFAPPARPVDMAVKRVSTGVLREWPGLPRGVKFDPSDEEFLWHLLAKVGKLEVEPHPLISEFIISLDEDDGFGYTHPQKLPGVKQDGSMSYFFHRAFKAFNSHNRMCRKMKNDDFGGVRWHKIGKTEPVIVDGIQQGCKRIMFLYVDIKKGQKPEKTNWVMHQYHLGRGEDVEGEFVASKIFYQQTSRSGDKNVQDLNPATVGAFVTEAEAAVDPISARSETHGENQHLDHISMEAFAQDGLSSRFVNINKYATGRVQDEPHLVDAQFPLEVCCADSTPEIASAKFISTSPIDSPDSAIAQNLFVVERSPPRVLNCQNTIFLFQTSIPEVKSSLVEEEHGCRIDNSDTCSSAFQAHLKAEPLEEGCVNSLSEIDAAMEYSARMLGSTVTGFEEGSCRFTECLSEARSCPDNLLSEVSKSQESNYKCLNGAHVSDSKLSNLVHQNNKSQLFDSVPRTFPTEVKAEPFEESDTNCSLGTTVEKLQCNNNQLFDSSLSSFPVNANAIPLGGSYTNSVPEVISGELQNDSETDYLKENFSAVTHCSSRDNPLSVGRIFQENILSNCTFSHDALLPENVRWKSNATELMSTKVSCSGSSPSSEDPFASQFSEKADSCQDNVPLTGINFQEETDSVCFGKVSFPEVHFDATNKLQNSMPDSPIKVKPEPLESGQLVCKNPPSSSPDFNASRVMVKGEYCDEVSDELDHIPLKYRIEMPTLGSVSNLDGGKSPKCFRKTMGNASKCDPVDSLNAKSSHFSLRSKRKKTATDSVETALEEDAPGLLQVLLDKGITVGEIKLYGDTEVDEALEISSSDDSFEDLATVITKLFSERSSLSMGCQTNSSKAVYSLACLISLIEQTRYLMFRNSPVEWGWCRDLQSFIFVFERHNRIVLERPEYGYATYFFEFVDSLPIDWQIKRLVTAMKLASCSRTALIENRPLMVGEDLTEGEARVLEGYGWTPNSGLGSMLNYCDRVVHDKKYERDISDWRAKIGKLLMFGHDGGRTIVANVSNKFVDYMGSQSPSIKSEL